jgi:diketogulonate reductase-like aldo/keto reductase
MAIPTTTLPSGDRMPVLGFGTGGLDGERLRTAVDAAVDAGYCRFDTAEGYGNEAALGDALAEYDRADLFVASKALPRHLDYESVIASCEASLDRLGTDYLDLYMPHWPNPAVSLRETTRALARLVDRGLVRNVGVSNVTPYQLSCARHVSPVPISVCQTEVHPWRQQSVLREYCTDHGIAVDAAAPLARTEVFDDPAISEAAAAHGVTPAQVVLRWALDRGLCPIPGSATPEHVRANAALFDWELTEDERARVDALDRDRSVYNLDPTDWDDDTFGISE